MFRLFVLILSFYFISFSTSSIVLFVVLDQDYLYNCPTTGSPRDTITWRIEGNTIGSNSSAYTIYPNGSLLITPITPKITGHTILNECCLNAECHSFIFFLSAINTPIADNETGLEFTDITIECFPNGSQPAPRFSWYRNDTWISSDRETVLRNVTRADSGEYTCIINNVVGSKRVDIEVTIEYTPSSEIEGEQNRFVRIGSTVELVCRFDGLPIPGVNWYFSRTDPVFSDSQEIRNPIISNTNAESVTLTLFSIKYNQTGHYFCSAGNAHGNATSLVHLTVQRRAESPLVYVSNVQSRSFTIGWSYRDNGNSPLTNTFIELRINTSSQWQNNLISDNATMGYTPTGLSANSLYFIRVSVDNALGRSLYAATTALTLPIPPPVPRGVELRVISHVSLMLLWRAPLLTFEQSPVESYELQLRSATDTQWNPVVRVSATLFRWSFQGLYPGTLYQSRIRCANSAGYSLFQEVQNRTNYTIPGPPVLSATPLDFKTIRVSWTPGSDGGVPLRTWTLEISEDAVNWRLIMVFPASEDSYDIRDSLTPNTSYDIRIWVSNRIGSSPTVGTQATTLPKSPLPTVDSDITAVFIFSTSIKLSWQPVHYTDIAFALEYQIGYSLLSESVQPNHHVTTNKTVYTIENLLPLSTYRFEIQARDGAELSETAVVFAFTTTLPDVRIQLRPAVPLLGHKLKLSCDFTERYRGVYEPAYVSWLKGGLQLLQEQKIPQVAPGYFYMYKNHLVIPKLHTSHYGNYSCRVGSSTAELSVSGKSLPSTSKPLGGHMETFIIAIVLVAVFILFVSVVCVLLCCIICVRKRRKAQIVRYPVGIPTKSWFNPSAYSPLRTELAGFNPLKTETSSHVPPRDSILEGDDYPEGEHTYTTSFLHNNLSSAGNTPAGTVDRPVVPRSTILPLQVAAGDERESSQSSKMGSEPPGPPLPPPFSAEEVFGDNISLPKRLTITEGMTSLRVEREPAPSPPSSVRTAPNANYENLSADSDLNPPQSPLYQNLPVDNNAQHVLGVEMLQLPNNCISTDI